MTGGTIRDEWIDMLLKISLPVLEPLSRGELKATMSLDCVGEARGGVAYLEAFGRTMTGLAPWLAAPGLDAPEEALRERTAKLARQAFTAAVLPQSLDRMDFLDGEMQQPIVDAAFLALGLLRAYDVLWEPLDPQTKEAALTAFRQIRRKKTPYNNWLLFSATVEAFLYRAGAGADPMRIDFALKEFARHWYAGDGLYSDGEAFHMDYYNSYVIQPMLLMVLDTVGDMAPDWAALREPMFERAVRFSQIQERMIAPDGSFPATGRSICYRMGAFQGLADIALRERLPATIPPAAARGALTAVIRRCTVAPENFDAQGFLTVGLCGYQPSLREEYINTGSLYLCMSAFLPLGLSPKSDFWSAPDQLWSNAKIWAGLDVPADHCM